MMTVMNQAREYMAETAERDGSIPEQGTDEFLEWANAFRVDINTDEDYAAFSQFCGRNTDDIDDQTEFLSGENVDVDWGDVAVEMFSYEVLTEEAL